jgi:uncharacterized protein with HEPN domain
MRRKGNRLCDIFGYIGRIEKYAVRNDEAIAGDEPTQSLILHHLQIISGVVFKISRSSRPGLRRSLVADSQHVRDALALDYFVVGPDMV